jgi:hypothetical protein
MDWETLADAEKSELAGFEELVTEMMEFVAKCIGEPRYYQEIFVQAKKLLMVNVGFTFLKTTAMEREKMVNDSDDFVHLALDTCDKQRSGIIKTQAAKILEALCDHIEGSTSFLAVFACKALDWALQGKPNLDTAEGEYIAVLQQVKDSVFLRNYSPEEIADCCMMALTMVSYIIPKRPDLVRIFDETMYRNFDKMTAKETILLRSRLCLLLGYYADMVFMKAPAASS